MRIQTMAKRVGSTKGIIDWSEVLKSILPKSGDYNTPGGVIERSSAELDNKLDPKSVRLKESYTDIMDTWINSNYDLHKIQWYDYYPGEHFDIEVQNRFANLVNADPRRVFVSELWPGRCVPYHWDVEDKEEEWLQEGSLVRYVCFMDQPKFGHVLILENECYYNIQQHEIYEWHSYKSHHAGTNAGSEPYYLFHFLGKPR